MERQPPQSENGYSPADTSSVRRRHDPEYTRSVLGIPALLGSTIGSLQSSDKSAQHRDDTSTTGKLSEDSRVAQTQNLSDSDLPVLDHEAWPPKETQTDTQFARSVGGAAAQDHQDTLHMSGPVKTPAVSGSNNALAASTHNQTQPLSFNPSVPAEPGPVGTISIAKNPTAAQPPGQNDYEYRKQQDDGRRGERKREELDDGPADDGELLLQHDLRRGSVLTSPLTHPNGVSMFPDLSTPEQEQLAQEALTQAEDSIVADNIQDFENESDGGYESDGFSSGSTSAESSVRDYMFENGRRYHRFREGHYNFPNEDVEQEREDMKHAMVKLLCSQKLHFAPIGNNPQEILDIGTGTGIWAIESTCVAVCQPPYR